MSTAHEIEMRLDEARPKLLALANDVQAMVVEASTRMSVLAVGREVGTQRARKLRRRGYDVQYFSETTTGKARYKWLRRYVWAFEA